ncbi:hypothetical protein PTTG_09654 [Puccinia triticina 1-1 BBBD Race 1]|uniref:RlpA-like protein double-psi beta-barrel domain-containing protein n=2 Tax=Puccinia triticina TaxID=208348 RepID=A0A180GBY7_PUCT1|nr:uncharacterized protein PtA15_7A10 [Puccinia triticina]OAV89413.1 hypothetical protein PTTG_09654 [Puccinia triticina 1-1 BBBD Race 1]WAQ86284.1 hypothetical protein PtA15_7A10 [Puccinia triticina]WAR56162.1 hypothetical protein PtB15_7B7 [Puccinia triticina]
MIEEFDWLPPEPNNTSIVFPKQPSSLPETARLISTATHPPLNTSVLPSNHPSDTPSSMALRLAALLLSLATLTSQLQLGLSTQLNPQQRLAKRSHLQKRGEGTHGGGSFAGRASWFDPELGACGKHNGPADFIVALDAGQFNQGWCNKKIKISFGGKSTVATIVDECPGCPMHGLDMSPSLFEFFAAKEVGIFYMNWSVLDGSSDSDPAPKPEPSPPSPPPPPPPKPQDNPQPKDQEPHKNENQPPPKTESQSTPPKEDPTKKNDPPPAYKTDSPPQYTTSSSTSNPFTAFQSNSNLPAGTAGVSLVSRPSTPAATQSSTALGLITNPASPRPNSQTNPYAPGGNLDAINQLVISLGSLAAVSAGNALNNPS